MVASYEAKKKHKACASSGLRNNYCELGRVHTNPLKCTLDQIASNRFKPICICSIHTLLLKVDFEKYIV